MQEVGARYREIKAALPESVCLIAVSKTYPTEHILPAYEAGCRDFGENRVQELITKVPEMPQDIRWHLIGPLQRNKVKYIASFIHLIHSVDSNELLAEISKQAVKHKRVIRVLIQIHVAQEDTKAGMSPEAYKLWLQTFVPEDYPGVEVVGLMTLASFTDDEEQIRSEFELMQALLEATKASEVFPKGQIQVLSMGMSGDYPMAIECGATHIRVGSSIFGSRKQG